jgi:hypothetical protein
MDRNGSGLEWHGPSLTRSVGGGVKKKKDTKEKEEK